MMGWVVRIIAAGGVIVSGTQGVANYVESLPPRPEQSAIVCHDAGWEQENLVAAGGGRFHKKLAPFIQSLTTEAQAADLSLSATSSYRSCGLQLSLRQSNCGLGEYNLYQKPSNQCTPPTEPAGRSLHNEGLAADFRCNGYALIERSPCFSWLEKNAVRYHLIKHPAEPWHWSTTGK